MRLGEDWKLVALQATLGPVLEEIVFRGYIDGSFCTEKPDPGDVDGYWVEPYAGVYDRIDPYWIDFELVLVPHVRKWKWRMWADHGVEFFIHPAMQASAEMGSLTSFDRTATVNLAA